MVSFKKYQSYEINPDNLELFALSRFHVRHGNVEYEKTFRELMEFLQLNRDEEGHVKGYKIVDSLSETIVLTIEIGEDTYHIRAKSYQLGILWTILTFQKLAKSGWMP